MTYACFTPAFLVIKTADGGATWTDVTGDLNTKNPITPYWDYWWTCFAVLRSKSTNNIVAYVRGKYRDTQAETLADGDAETLVALKSTHTPRPSVAITLDG